MTIQVPQRISTNGLGRNLPRSNFPKNQKLLQKVVTRDQKVPHNQQVPCALIPKSEQSTPCRINAQVIVHSTIDVEPSFGTTTHFLPFLNQLSDVRWWRKPASVHASPEERFEAVDKTSEKLPLPSFPSHTK